MIVLMFDYLFISEFVFEGHFDKICDRIFDVMVDMYLMVVSESRVGVEIFVITNRIVFVGEVRGSDFIICSMMEDVVRICVKEIGYE